jgi:hypothetical protein
MRLSRSEEKRETATVSMEAVVDSSSGRASVERRKSRQRSRVANGSALWAGIDGRSLWARRAGELLAATISDLGGSSNISEGERALAKRAAVLITELERREAAFAQAGGADDAALAIYQTTVNTLRRTLESLGLRRRPRDVTPPSVADYLAHKAKLKEAAP